MQIKNFDKGTISLLRGGMEAELASVAKKYGVTISFGRTIYFDQNVTFKVTATVNTQNGMAQSKEAADFKRSAGLFGLSPNDLGREFTVKGETFQITGLKPNNHKFPILAKKLTDGKIYKLSYGVIPFSEYRVFGYQGRAGAAVKSSSGEI